MSLALDGTNGITMPIGTVSNAGIAAWVVFNGVTTASITASYNVTSVTRVSAGLYNITMTNALVDANYAICANANFAGGGYAWIAAPNTATTPTTTVFQILVVDANAASDKSRISVAVFR